jgi:mannitol/fructose-specific phosphotransferase system IIA component (Ntr-type)
MKEEKIEKALEMIRKSGVTVAGDLVLEKHVDKEIGNVENGGIGIMINGKEVDWKDARRKAASSVAEPSAPKGKEHQEEVFKFIHPAVDSEETEWQIHNEIKRLVTKQGIQEICQYLKQMANEKRILLPQNAEKVYNELVRIGMPDGEGYNLKTFRNCYTR